MQLINLKTRHSNCSNVKHIRCLSELRLHTLITHLQIFLFLLMTTTQSLVSFSSRISTSILLQGNLPQFLHFKIANNIDFICKKKYCYGNFITELGISKNKTLVTLLTKILVSTKKEFWVITSHSCNQLILRLMRKMMMTYMYLVYIGYQNLNRIHIERDILPLHLLVQQKNCLWT